MKKKTRKSKSKSYVEKITKPIFYLEKRIEYLAEELRSNHNLLASKLESIVTNLVTKKYVDDLANELRSKHNIDTSYFDYIVSIVEPRWYHRLAARFFKHGIIYNVIHHPSENESKIYFLRYEGQGQYQRREIIGAVR